MKRPTARMAALLILGMPAHFLATPSASGQDEDEKRTFALTCVPKGGLTGDDRAVVAEYLAENGDDLPKAPRAVAEMVKVTRLWTSECAEHAMRLPRKLTKLLSSPPAGTERFLFDRALIVVDTNSGRILARVEAE